LRCANDGSASRGVDPAFSTLMLLDVHPEGCQLIHRNHLKPPVFPACHDHLSRSLAQLLSKRPKSFRTCGELFPQTGSTAAIYSQQMIQTGVAFRHHVGAAVSGVPRLPGTSESEILRVPPDKRRR